jgi:hypothetical protein
LRRRISHRSFFFRSSVVLGRRLRAGYWTTAAIYSGGHRDNAPCMPRKKLEIHQMSTGTLIRICQMISGGKAEMARKRSCRSTCENCQSIDVRQLHRDGRLRTPQSFPLAWKIGDEACGGIQVRTDYGSVVLRFQCQHAWSSEWKLVEQSLRITWTKCALGGRRPWFVCNSEKNSVLRCDRRVAKIYLGANPVFACRQCQRLSYASQNKTARLRLIGKAMKIRMQLGGSPNLFDPFPNKPKGLHSSTYERLRKIHDEADKRLGIRSITCSGLA